MYFWIIAVVLSFGIYTSYFVHGKRALPLSVLIISVFDIAMIQKGSIGAIGLTILALLAIIILGANMISEKMK